MPRKDNGGGIPCPVRMLEGGFLPHRDTGREVPLPHKDNGGGFPCPIEVLEEGDPCLTVQ